jgi:hypothetical protein
MKHRFCGVCGDTLAYDYDIERWLDGSNSVNCAYAQDQAATTMAISHEPEG